MPSSPPLTRREVLGAAVLAGALGTDVAAQESDSGSDEATPTAGKGDWPTFQDGPHNAGFAPSARGPIDDGEVTWARPLGSAGFSAPAVVDGTLFVGTLEGTVVALSADTGKPKWEFETDDDVVSSPAVSDLHLYVGSNDGRVYALRRADGAERWSFETGDSVQSSPALAVVESTSEEATTSATGTPRETDARGTGTGDDAGSGSESVAGGRGVDQDAEKRVFVGSDDGTLYALSADDGSVRWTYEVGRPVGSPAVRVPGDEAETGSEPVVYVGDREGGVYALSAVDGAERWTTELDGAVAAPTVAGDDVYAAAGDGGLYALSAADGTEKWQFDHGPARSPAVAGDRLYVAVRDEGVYALSASDGLEQWHADLGGDLGPPAVAGVGERDSSAGTGGTVFVSQGAGVIVRALAAADGSQRWAAELDGRLGAAPAVVGETLYLNAGTVAAFDEVERTPTPSHTPWDAGVVLESWMPAYLTWLGTYVGVPAVLGALVYALGRVGRGDRGDDRASGDDGTDDPGRSSESGPSDDSADGKPDDGSADGGSDFDPTGGGSGDSAGDEPT